MDKPTVLFCGDLVAPTGFSTVLHNIIKHVKDDVNVIGLGVNYRGDPHNYDFPIYPATNGPSMNIYGVDRMVNMLNGMKIDVVFILNDSWVISYYLDAIKKNVKNLPKIIVYFPVDSEEHNSEWYKDFDIVTRAFTYTEFGRNVVNKANPDLDIGIIPHGVDTSVFFPIKDSKANIRRALFGESAANIPNLDDLFIVLNANRNQPRKRLDVTMHGFSLFAQDKEDVKLYMHSGIRDSSIDISYISKRYGIDNKLIVTSLTSGIQRVELDKLNLIYNACNVGINTSMGEGWGLTNVEHAVTGAVQIVPRHSSCQEIFSDCGMLLETALGYTFDNSQTVGKLIAPEEVARGLDVLYKNRKLMADLANKGYKKLSSPEYQWSTIAQTFLNAILEVCK